MDLRNEVVKFAFESAKHGRQWQSGNFIDKEICEPYRVYLRAKKQLGEKDNSRFDWCAAWCAYIHKEKGIDVPFIMHNYYATTAKAEAWRHLAVQANAWYFTHSQIPSSGDLVCFQLDKDMEVDHIGILTDYVPAAGGLVRVAQGNWNDKECVRASPLKQVLGFIDLEILAQYCERMKGKILN